MNLLLIQDNQTSPKLKIKEIKVLSNICPI